jgi:hypothetical protein
MGDEIRPDIAEAVKRMGWKVGSKRELRKLPEHLHPNERVRYLATGTYGNGNGLIVLTSTRLMFIKDGWTGGRIEDVPISKVSSIQWATGLALGKIIIFASGNRVEILNVQKQAGKSITDAVRDDIAGHSGPPTSAPAPPAMPPLMPSTTTSAPEVSASEKIARLKELGELRDAGIIEDHEFASMKAEIMGTVGPVMTAPPPSDTSEPPTAPPPGAPPPPPSLHNHLPPPPPASHDHLPPPPPAGGAF